MHALAELFPANDFRLVAAILALPALGAFVNGVFGKRLGKEAVRLMALTAIGGAFALSLLTFAILLSAGEETVQLTWTAWHWLDLSTDNGLGSHSVDVKFMVDHLNVVMMLVITGVGFLIHLYASAYMWDDPRKDGGYHRFFAYLNLFCFAMLVLVLGASMPILFVGWEGVGLCSYLLIGFWYADDANAAAGKKAFLANRVGDFGLLCAMALLLWATGSLDWAGIGEGAGALLERVQVWPIGNGALAHWFPTPVRPTIATLVALSLFLGCAGKSAQIPLYVWLPDAMAGPTPVSALIHAATMVTAGVYLVCRLSGVFLLSPVAMAVVAFTGALTALLAASIGLVQHDIKKVLAYSTVSQLGFMFIGVGVGAFTAGFFHVFTHAFFKACLFLGAGSVIHAMHAGIHDSAASQDMRNMGGLRRFMPLTRWTYLASCIAIAGVPFFSGFFSKDEILYRAFVHHIDAIPDPSGLPRWSAPAWFGPMIYGMGIVAATMTAFYMFRSYFLTFGGEFRGWRIDASLAVAGHGSDHDAHASHADHGDHGDDHGHDALGDDHGHDDDHGAAHASRIEAGPAPHESPWQMTLPLVVLGAFAVLAGYLNAGMLHMTWMEHWLEPVFRGAEERITVHHASEIVLALPGVGAAAVGIGLAYWVYALRGGEPAQRWAAALPRLHALVFDKWRIDELYENTVLALLDSLAETATSFDKWFVDGIIARLTAAVVQGLGAALRLLQTGGVHAYAAMMVVGLVALGRFFLGGAHASLGIVEPHTDRMVVEAAAGPGYRYRWYTTSQDKPDRAEWSDARTVEVGAMPAGTSRTIGVEVKDAFEHVSRATLEVSAPAAHTETQGAGALPDLMRMLQK